MNSTETQPKIEKCRRCGWILNEREETYCSSCVERMHEDQIENETDEMRLEEAKKYNSIIKTDQ